MLLGYITEIFGYQTNRFGFVATPISYSYFVDAIIQSLDVQPLI